MRRITYSGNLFADEPTNCLIDEAGFKQQQCEMYIYYKYVQDVPKLVVLSYVYGCIYWYTSEELGNRLVDKLGKRFHVKFL